MKKLLRWFMISIALVMFTACGGGGSSADASSIPIDEASVEDFVGFYNAVGVEYTYEEFHIGYVFETDGTMTWEQSGTIVNNRGGFGSWYYDPETLVFMIVYESGEIWEGVVSGNVDDFILEGIWSHGSHATVRFYR